MSYKKLNGVYFADALKDLNSIKNPKLGDICQVIAENEKYRALSSGE